ncbi:MAG: adenosine deaminase, partial [Planctomycetota bacterium]
MSGDLRQRLRRLPKTELHLHTMGAIRPTTAVELAWRKDSAILEAAERGAEEGYEFADLSSFIRFFLGLFELVVDAETFERITFETLEDAADLGVKYVELRWTPTSHLARGAEEERMFAGIQAAQRAAERLYGIHSRLIVDFPRGLPLAVAEEALAVAIRRRPQGVTGFDIAGDESRVAADEKFAPLFRTARKAGLCVAAHAGEAAGPDSVRGALDLYDARRIGHGTRAAEDAALLARLAREGVVLEVCPSSNVALRVVPSVAAHPVTAFVAAGVPCCVSTDDPALFGTDILTEHLRL